MKMKNGLRGTAGFLAAAWAVLALVACGSGAGHNEQTLSASYSVGAEAPAMAYDDGALYVYDMDMAEITMEESGVMDTGEAYSRYSASATNSAGESEPYPADDRKIIMNAWVTIESLEYDEATTAIDTIINGHGAYISSSGVYNSTYGSRSADYTVRVPAENYRSLLAALESAGNMISRSESSEDVTTQYIDIEARLTSLYAQEERLMELMGEAGDLESLILVQQQLSEVQYQIEYYEGLQRSFDRQIAYSTIQVHLYEVVEYTEPEPEGYLSQIARAFRNGWKNALVFVQGIGLAIVGGLPVLIALAILAVVLVILLKRSRQRSAQKLAEMREKTNAGGVTIKDEPAPEKTEEEKE